MSEYLDKTGLSYFWGKVKEKIADSVKSVNYATSAGSATKATQDGLGQTITSTYIKSVGIYGKTLNDYTLNYLKGDAGTPYIQQIDFLNAIYPVGSFYISATKSVDPNKFFGGTWIHIMSKFKFTSDDTNPQTSPVIIDHECDVWERTK